MEEDALLRRKEAMEMTPLERILLGLRLGYAMPLDEPSERELQARAEGQADLHHNAPR